MYQQPDHRHIQLKLLDVASVIEFIFESNHYQQMHDVSVKMSTKMTPDIVDILIAFGQQKGLTKMVFFQQDNEEIQKLLQKVLRPASKLEFEKVLILNTPFTFKGSPADHPVNFYRALMKYRRTFMDVFEFLAAKNSSNLPRVNNKPKGLISIFLRPLPKGYAGNINAELCSSYATMHEFIEE